jgi:hypothetical protein
MLAQARVDVEFHLVKPLLQFLERASNTAQLDPTRSTERGCSLQVSRPEERSSAQREADFRCAVSLELVPEKRVEVLGVRFFVHRDLPSSYRPGREEERTSEWLPADSRAPVSLGRPSDQPRDLV